jgi:predicted kinase
VSRFPFSCPEPPHWRVDWDTLDRQFSWIRALRDCPQDHRHHAEGNVWIHVRMVCEAMAASPEWRALPADEREILFATAIFHDVAKPACTREENGWISSRGHSARGAIDARRILWEHGTPFAIREQVCALVRHHQVPYRLIQRDDAERLAYAVSQSARGDLLTEMALADVRGRICKDQAEILLRVELFREFCRERECLFGPRAFASAHSRFEYFRRPDRDASYAAFDNTRFEVILMCGLPGSGKDTWIAEHAGDLPCVSLDALREEGVGDEGAVVHTARDQAREYLRRQQPFVWNATNLTRERRAPLLDLFANYDARTRLVYVETAHDELWRRNVERHRPVPRPAVERMIDRWEVPTVEEAHRVEYVAPA